MVDFLEGKLREDGTLLVKHTKSIEESSMRKCPHVIMVHEHYRNDESCRCDDPDHKEMSEWGYVWDGKLWN